MTLLHDRYRLVRALGTGGGGHTWLAEDTRTGDQVTVKELHTPFEALVDDVLERETRLLGQLRHPQIPRFVEAFVEEVRLVKRLHLVLEYVEGVPLHEEMAARRYDQAEARAIVEDLLGVVAWLHAQAPPVLHRDIKPSNVIRRADGKVVLIDFGVATDAVDRTFLHTMAVGTLGYQAPEQIAGDPRPQSDVYSVGVLALELLTRVPPRDLLDGQKIRWEGRARHLDPHWQAWLRRALDPDPAARFPDARAALRALVDPSPVAEAPSPPAPARGGAPLWLVTSAVVSIAFAGLFVSTTFEGTKKDEARVSTSIAPAPAVPLIPEAPLPPPPGASGGAACRAGDGPACLTAAAALLVAPVGAAPRAADRDLAHDLLATGCMGGHAPSCEALATDLDGTEPARAARWWAEACVLDHPDACPTFARRYRQAPDEGAALLARLTAACVELSAHPDDRTTQARCGLAVQWHAEGLDGAPDPDAAQALVAAACRAGATPVCERRDLPVLGP